MSLENLVTQSRPYTSEDALNQLIKTMKADTNKISDGYHTFEELYEFRKVYNASLFNEWAKPYMERVAAIDRGDIVQSNMVFPKYDVHKSWKHSDGKPCFGGGWFIVVAVLPNGQISNHYEEKDWDLFKIPETEKAKHEFDGHTAFDVIQRLKSL